MNKNTVLFHLKEAKEELDKTIEEIENQKDYDDDNLYLALQHLYHHINSWWNWKNKEINGWVDFNKNRQFPKDIDMHSDIN